MSTAKTTLVERRYFLGHDDSAHTYLVPAEHRDGWYAWVDQLSSDEPDWEVPPYARRIDGPHRLTFTDPQE